MRARKALWIATIERNATFEREAKNYLFLLNINSTSQKIRTMFSQTSHKYARLQSSVFNGLEKNGKIFVCSILENKQEQPFLQFNCIAHKKPQARAHSEFFAHRGTNLMFLRNNVPPSNSLRECFAVYMVKLT